MSVLNSRRPSSSTTETSVSVNAARPDPRYSAMTPSEVCPASTEVSGNPARAATRDARSRSAFEPVIRTACPAAGTDSNGSPSATTPATLSSGGASVEGWTITHGCPCVKIAWYWFSPSWA